MSVKTKKSKTSTVLKDHEKRLTQFFEASNEGLFFHHQGKILDVNPAINRLFGYPLSSIIGENLLKFVAPECQEDVKQKILSGYEGAYETIGLHQDGRYIPVEVRATTIESEGQKLRVVAIRDISEKKQTERKIHYQQTLLEAVFRDVPDAMILSDLKREIIMSNPAITRVFGYLSHEVIGRKSEILYESDSEFEDHERERNSLGEREKLLPYIVKYKRKNGEVFSGETTGTIISDDGGEVVGYLCVIRDISSRLDAEKALKESEQRLSSIMNNASAVIYVKDINGQYLMVNKRHEELFHISTERIRGQSDFDIFPEETARQLRENDLAVLGSLKPIESEEVVPQDDGIHTYISIKFCLFNSELKPYAVCGISTDITERKAAEKILKQSKQELEALVKEQTDELIIRNAQYQILTEKAVDGIYILDEFGNIRDLNTQARENLGYSEEEIKTLTVFDIDLDTTPEKYREKINNVQPGCTISFETSHHRKDRSIFPVEINATHYLEGNELNIIAIARDISERKRTEMELVLAKEEAEAANSAKGEFLSTASHELRTPITATYGALEIIINQYAKDLPKQFEELLHISHRNSKRLIRLVNDILDTEKIDSGSVNFDIKRQTLMPVVKQVVEINSTYMGQSCGRIHIIETVSDKIQVYVDSERLIQVLSNLLSNAIKFSPANEIVEVAVRKHGNKVQVFISDHGAGISKDFHKKIFQKFSQADTSDSRRNSGTGLGLHISKNLIEKMGGTIGFNSIQGRGSSFWIELDIAQDDNIH